MKTEQDLTDADINRMVAECEGWRLVRKTRVPDFANSRDAIMPCVKGLNEIERIQFVDSLLSEIDPYNYDARPTRETWFAAITASPRCIALAYLKAKGKL